MYSFLHRGLEKTRYKVSDGKLKKNSGNWAAGWGRKGGEGQRMWALSSLLYPAISVLLVSTGPFIHQAIISPHSRAPGIRNNTTGTRTYAQLRTPSYTRIHSRCRTQACTLRSVCAHTYAYTNINKNTHATGALSLMEIYVEGNGELLYAIST